MTMSSNSSLTSNILPTVEKLNEFVSKSEVLDQLGKISEGLILEISEDQPYAVAEPALNELPTNVPKEIGTIRVAVFHPAVETSVERHVNSDQYLYSIKGSGRTQVERNGQMENDHYGEGEQLTDRWHYVPMGVWHRSIADSTEPWAVVAFHTARNVEDEYQ
eukprot:gb/GECG01006242.1/.p1 GENE.gb/GECG01006242.1/~~gb/GECG01006242.1/.p1  ORF type:complete len:162 (+),score=14.12 gb/GECG01006242.1/:1-486(+)